MLTLQSWVLLSTMYVVLDLLNFKVLAPSLYNSFYKDGIVDHTAAAAIYLLYPVAIVYFTMAAKTPDEVIRRGFVLGITTYGIYHLTNMATLRNWSGPVAAWDTFWGGVVTSVVAYIAFRFNDDDLPK